MSTRSETKASPPAGTQIAETAPAVAITGGLGCGKSEVVRLLRADGVPVLDADEVAREVVRPGGEALRQIAARFGAAVLLPDGSLDRRRLAQIVFADAEARAALNAIVHPAVRASMRAWVVQQRAAGRPCAGAIPLLYEVGAESEWDSVVCVAAADDISGARLRARGWDDAEIARRRAAQWRLEEKMQRADSVIENNGSLEELAARVRAAWKEILEKESHHGR